ncbi:MAG: PilZ domain-containing protein [Candidatus Acidiferrum sp.]
MSFTEQEQRNNESAEKHLTAGLPFVADAELTEKSSGTRIVARLSEISLNGCYLAVLHGFPKGSEVFVKIFTRTDFFESAAIVTCYQPNLGVGLSFRDTSRHFKPTLQRWLLQVMKANYISDDKS